LNNGARAIPDQHNSFTAKTDSMNHYRYELSVSCQASDSSQESNNTLRISTNFLPETGETLLIPNVYATDSSYNALALYGPTYYSHGTDTLSAILIGIPFNDSIDFINSDTIVNKKDINEKHAFSFSFKWGSNEIKGSVYWIKFTTTYTSSCNGFFLSGIGPSGNTM
jgi:hypothetical protein